MEKKDIAGLLLKIGVILYIGSSLLMIIFGIFWIIPRPYWLIISVLAFIGLLSFVIGGFMRKKDRSYKVVIIGITMIFGGIFLNSLVFGIGDIFTGFSIIVPIIIILGIIFVIIGALTEDRSVS
ncbi:MAG: hypothetical protein ACFE8C_04790 [Promethearchaeota archaeon]